MGINIFMNKTYENSHLVRMMGNKIAVPINQSINLKSLFTIILVSAAFPYPTLSW